MTEIRIPERLRTPEQATGNFLSATTGKTARTLRDSAAPEQGRGR